MDMKRVVRDIKESDIIEQNRRDERNYRGVGYIKDSNDKNHIENPNDREVT